MAEAGKLGSMQKNSVEAEMLAKYEEEKNRLEAEYFLSINAFKGQLDEDLEKLQEKLTAENSKKVVASVSDKRENFYNELKALANKKQRILDNCRLKKTALEKEYEVRFGLLPDAKVAESEKLKAELRVEEMMQALKLSLAKSLSSLSSEVETEQLELKKKLEKEFETKKQEYIKEADEEISRKQSSNQEESEKMRKLLKELTGLAASMRTTKGETRELQATVKNKGRELEHLNASTSHLKVKAQFPVPSLVQPADSAKHETIIALKSKLESKNKEIGKLTAYLSTMKTEPVIRVADTESKSDAFAELQAINTKLDEIKRCLSHDSAPRIARQTYSHYITPSAKKHAKKLSEVSTFIDAENSRLLLVKQSMLRDYKVSVKLLRGLQGNVSEWSSELSELSVDQINPIIGGVKTGLEKQIEALNKQIGKIRYLGSECRDEVVHAERRLEEVESMRLLLKDYYRRSDFGDSGRLVSQIVEEYKDYMCKHGREDSAEDLHSNRGLDCSEDEDAIVYKYKTECKGRRNLNSDFQGLYKDVINYNNTLKTMYRRDLVKLGGNRNAANEPYTSKKNWLSNIKTQPRRHKYSFI